jgi:glycosyltransferase involved in cell wall biosynthesis
MEALAAGRPVISTNVAGIAELVTPECGWLVPAGSIDALVDTITEALTTPSARLVEMGQAGRRLVRENHDVDKEAGALRALIERAVEGASAGAGEEESA